MAPRTEDQKLESLLRAAGKDFRDHWRPQVNTEFAVRRAVNTPEELSMGQRIIMLKGAFAPVGVAVAAMLLAMFAGRTPFPPSGTETVGTEFLSAPAEFAEYEQDDDVLLTLYEFTQGFADISEDAIEEGVVEFESDEIHLTLDYLPIVIS